MKIMTHQMHAFSEKRSLLLYVTSIFLLVVMVFSAISHSHELYLVAEQSQEQAECKLCQLKVDTPKQVIKLSKVTFGYFTLEKKVAHQECLLAAQYRSTNPRAPPYST